MFHNVNWIKNKIKTIDSYRNNIDQSEKDVEFQSKSYCLFLSAVTTSVNNLSNHRELLVCLNNRLAQPEPQYSRMKTWLGTAIMLEASVNTRFPTK